MKKLDPNTDGKTANIIDQNITKVKEIFPDAFTEGRINYEVLRQLLGDAIDEGEEKYGLSWNGKKKARQISLTPSLGTLRPCKEESVDWDTTQNLFIEGDNLEVLKLLQKSYANKVKMIYIDPPYNTGKEFIYPDKFQDNLDTYLRYTGLKNSEGDITSSIANNKNTIDSARYHTNWLNMIYPRLKLARNLLASNGVIFISISDHEYSNLKSVCDEIFHEDNFISCIVWNSTKSVTNTALISVGHTYNLVYAKSKDYFKENRNHFRLSEEGDGFSNPDNDPRGPWKADPFQVGGWRPNQQYEITNPVAGRTYKPNDGCSWKNDYKKFQELMEDGRIVFGASGEAGPQRKRFLSEAKDRGKVAKTWWDDVGTTTNGTKTVKSLFGGKSVFSNPKPVNLIKKFIELGEHTGKGVVLDFFAGSGTTAHAVQEINAEQSTERQYILIQLPETIDEQDKDNKAAIDYCNQEHLKPKITELAKRRLALSAKHISKTFPEFSGDLGFKVFKLDSSNIRAWNPNRNDLEQTLIDHIEHLVEGRSEEDVLYELLLKRGVDITVPIEEKTITGKTVYTIGYGVLFACLDKKINREEVEDLAMGIIGWHKELSPAGDTQVVFRDSAFDGDIAKTNMTAILEQHGIAHVRSL